MKNTTTSSTNHTQYQQVADAYGIGAIRHAHELDAVSLQANARVCQLVRVLIETDKGLFLLAHADDTAIHPIWWERDTDAFLHLVSRAVGLTYAVALATQAKEQFVVHRFDRRFTLFGL